jgi:hypothetical protein
MFVFAGLFASLVVAAEHPMLYALVHCASCRHRVRHLRRRRWRCVYSIYWRCLGSHWGRRLVNWRVRCVTVIAVPIIVLLRRSCLRRFKLLSARESNSIGLRIDSRPDPLSHNETRVFRTRIRFHLAGIRFSWCHRGSCRRWFRRLRCRHGRH